VAVTQFVIDLRAPSDKLAGDLGKAVRLVSSFSDSIKTVGATALGFAAAQVGLATLGTAFDVAKRAMVDFNSTMDAARLSFTFLMGSADEAKAHIADLSRVAEDTPFPTADFLQASRVLQGLGANAAAIPDLMRQIANAAAVAKVPLADATQAIGRFLSNISSGQGNATQGARALQAQGLISGALKGEIANLEAQGASAEALIAKFLSSLGKFDGAAKAAANNWEGLIVRIKDSLSDAAGIALQPFFRAFEELGRVFLKAINTDEAKRAFAEFGKSLFNSTETLVLALLQLWEPLAEVFRGFQDQATKTAQLFTNIANSAEALKRGMSVKDWIFSGPADIQKFLGENPILGPANENSAVERARATFKKIRDAIEAEAAATGGTGGAVGGSLFEKARPTPDQLAAIAEAERLLASLGPEADVVQKAVDAVGRQFDALAKAAGPAGDQVRALGEQAKKLVSLTTNTEFIKKWTDEFDQMTPTLDTIGRQIDAVRLKAEAFAKQAPVEQRNSIKSRADEVAEAILQFDRAKKALDALTESWNTDAAAARDWSRLETELRKPIDDLDDAIREHIVEIDALAVAMGALSGSGIPGQATFGQGQASALEAQIQRIARSRAQLNAALADIEPGTQFDELTAAIERADAELIRLGSDLRDTVEANRIEEFLKDFDLLSRQFQVFGGEFDLLGGQITRTVSEINRLLSVGAAANDESIRALKAQLDSLQNTKRVVDFIISSVELGMTRIADTMIDAFFAGEAAAIKWGDVVTNILRDITKELFKVFVIETALKAIRGIATSAFSGGGGDGGEIALMAGGIVTGPTHALIGEGGPEAVIPLDRLGKGGGGDVTINIHPPTGTESTAQESRDGQGNRTIDVFITKVVEKGISQGTFDRSFGSSFGLTRQGSRR